MDGKALSLLCSYAMLCKKLEQLSIGVFDEYWNKESGTGFASGSCAIHSVSPNTICLARDSPIQLICRTRYQYKSDNIN